MWLSRLPSAGRKEMRNRVSMIRTASRLAVAAAALLGAYVLAIRPWHLRWGATDKDVRRPMPGDDLVPHPFLDATRALTIRARPEEVWPWLVQMGYRRAGFYSYDFIDNARIPSADRIIPKLQHLEVGDILPTGPRDGFTVAALEPNRSLLLLIDEDRAQISFSTVLDEIDELHTRLIMRARARFKVGLLPGLYYLLFEPGDFVMMRKMMLGIKQRAEALAEQRGEQPRTGTAAGPLF